MPSSPNENHDTDPEWDIVYDPEVPVYGVPRLHSVLHHLLELERIKQAHQHYLITLIDFGGES